MIFVSHEIFDLTICKGHNQMQNCIICARVFKSRCDCALNKKSYLELITTKNTLFRTHKGYTTETRVQNTVVPTQLSCLVFMGMLLKRVVTLPLRIGSAVLIRFAYITPNMTYIPLAIVALKDTGIPPLRRYKHVHKS